MIPPYAEIAVHIGVTHCRACRDESIDHHKGESTFRTVHWTQRRATRPGVRRFLMLGVTALDPSVKALTPWMRIWIENARAANWAKLIRVSIPRHLTMKDRAQVRFYLSELTEAERSYYSSLYQQAERWASRKA